MSDNPTVARPRRGTPPALPAGDREANRRAALILEVLAGVRTAPQAAEALKISTNHYYLLERKALAGLLAACQPQPKGKRQAAEKHLTALERELQRSRQDCQRQAALVRALQRTVGVPASPPEKPKTRPAKSGRNGVVKKRRRRTSVRALRLAEELNQQAAAAEAVALGITETSRSSQKERQDGA